MELQAQNRLTRNAYRILGLGGDASQDQISQAARKMRLWANTRRIPATSWDLPWLGELDRTKSDIEQAVARLADPPTRLRERLMWFCGAAEEFAAQDVHAVRQTLEKSADQTDAQREHNDAVAELAAAMFQPQPIHPGSWESVLNKFQYLSNSQEHLHWQLRLENEGGFEKRASEAEIADGQREVPREIAGSLGRHIESALEDDNAEEASSFLAILRSVGGRTDQRVLDRLEEVFERRCRGIADDLRAGVHGHQPPQRNAATADGATRAFENSIVPLRRDLEKLADNQPERIKRIRWHCTRVLSMIGTAWVWSHEFARAEGVFNQALALAQGSVQEEEIRGQLAENAARAEEQRRRYTMVANAATTVGGTISLSNAGGIAPAGAGAVESGRGQAAVHAPAASRTVNYQPVPVAFVASPAPMVQKKKRSGSWAAIVAVAILVRLISVLVSTDSNSRSPDPPMLNFPDPPRSYYRPDQQPPLVPWKGPKADADEVMNRVFKKPDSTPPPAAPKSSLSSLYDGAPTSPREPRKPFDWSSPLPAAPQAKTDSAKPQKYYPEPPSRPPTQWINAATAGLSNDPPPKTGLTQVGGK